MKTFYISLSFFAILLGLLVVIYFVDIPSPSKNIVETFNLNIK